MRAADEGADESGDDYIAYITGEDNESIVILKKRQYSG